MKFDPLRLATQATLLALILFAPASRPARAESAVTSESEEIAFFKEKVLPVLTRHCYECHSKKSDEPQGGLRVDTRSTIRAGGGTGRGVVPRDPDASLVIEAVRYEEDAYQMPPAGKLSDEVIRDLERWVRIGAPDPREDPQEADAGER